MPASNGFEKPRSSNARVREIAAALLLGVGVAFSALVGPARIVRAQTIPTSARDALELTAKRHAQSHAKPFDLSYVPADVQRIVAIRPALILQAPGVKDSAFRVMSALVHHIGPLLVHLPQTMESIDQVVVWFAKAPEGAKAKASALEEPNCMMIRSIEEIDWKRFVQRDLGLRRDSDSPLIESGIKGKTHYKSTLKTSWIMRPGECYLFPDARTIVVGREKAVLRVIGQGRESRPELAKGDDWRAIETCPIALAVDKLDGERTLRHYDLVTSLLFTTTGEIEHAQRMTCGIDHLEALRLHAIVTLLDAEESRRSALALLAEQWTIGLTFSALRVMTALGMVDMEDNPAFTEPDDAPEVEFEKRLVEEMVRMGQVRLEGRTIHLTKQTRISLTDLILERI
jgi:hypothetical protein